MDDQRFAWSESAPFRVVADAVPQMMWSARADGWIDWYNARWYDYTAQTPDEASGWGWQAVHHPEDLPKVMLAWPRSIATGEPFEMEFRLRGADGQFRWFLTRATPLRGDDGRVARWFGTNTDIDGARGARAVDVGVRAEPARNTAVVAAQRGRAGEEPAELPVRSAQPELHLERFAGRDRARPGEHDLR